MTQPHQKSARPVALVTGGSRGIGRGICLELAGQGYALAINYAQAEEAARQTQSLVGEQSLLCRGDVGKSEDRDRIVDEVLAEFGRIDLLVNNAGIPSVGAAMFWRRLRKVGIVFWPSISRDPSFSASALAKEMIRLAGELSNPAIVNISSISANVVSVNRGDYCVSKAGLAHGDKALCRPARRSRHPRL